MDQPTLSLRPGTTLGRYTIGPLLGEGGMGAVYEATHRDLGKRVAIKTLLAQFSQSSAVRARFLREGQAASRIRHPHVVDVYDVGSDGDLAYLVMEFLEGEDLSKLLGKKGALPPQEAADILIPVIAAVATAHDLGIVHRDLKPENIFLCQERGSLSPKVVDFGISKIVDEHGGHALTGTAAFLGTPYYMSPEQAQGAKHIDARADQYSLGVIIYQVLVGKRPFDDPTLFSLMNRIVNGDFVPPRQVNPDIAEGLEALILKAMAKDPANRYATTRIFGRALLPFASARTQTLFGDEFAVDGAPAVSVGASDPAPSNPVSGTATTLGQSAHQIDTVPRGSVRRPRTLAIAGVTVVAVGAALFVVGRSGPDAPARPPQAVVTEAPPVAPVPAPAAPKPEVAPQPAVEKRLLSEPPGALVLVGGVEVGKTPHVLSITPGARVEVELRADGRSSERRTIVESDPEQILVRLEPKAKAAEKAGKASTAPARPRLAPR